MNTPIEYGQYYHIYNRGNNYEDIFTEDEDYQHFLNIYDIYIGPVADTYAWCLMKNHFHILVRIKEEHEVWYLSSDNSKSEDPSIKWRTYLVENQDKKFSKKPIPTQQFKHLFNAYSRWFNLKHGRRGSLFEKNYERKHIKSQKQLTNLIVYIHNNPVKHGFVESILEYPWTSYGTVISEKSTKLKRKELLSYFDDIENFEFVHKTSKEEDNKKINDLIIE